MMLGQALLCCLIGYLLGNISPAYLLVKRKGYDVREEGSGNAGASNALIIAGKAAFFITAFVDILKAFVACRLCRALFPGLSVSEQLGGVACILGHMFPLSLGLRGGKGLACMGGVILSWNWIAFLILLATALAIAFVTNYLCFVAPSISVIFPVSFLIKSGFVLGTLILLIPVLPIMMKHMQNFRNIREGTEVKMSYLWDKDSELKRTGRV